MMDRITLDSTISLYEGLVVRDRKRVVMAQGGYPSELERHKRDLARDQLILRALKYAQRLGFSEEE